MKDIFGQLYANLLKLTGAKGSVSNAVFRELFPSREALTLDKVSRLEELIGVDIHNPAPYEQALTHRSYLQVVNSPDHRSNERLEFLGDAILGMVTAEYLFYNHKHVLEGELTKMRSWIVNKKSLAICANALHLDEMLFLSFSARQSLQRGNDSMLADALEAIIAAVYLDRGFEEVRRFIVDMLLPIMVRESLVHDTNYKSLLLETSQAKGYGIPRYVVVREEGPDHEKFFTVEVYVADKKVGTGSGKNKKDAEQSAAQEALNKFSVKKRRTAQPEREAGGQE